MFKKKSLSYIFQGVGFIFEVNGFFWSGYLYTMGYLVYSLILLVISFAIALAVGESIYRSGHKTRIKILKRVPPTPQFFYKIKNNYHTGTKKSIYF